MKLDLRCDVTAAGRSISSFAIVLAVYLSMAASASAVTFNPTPPQSYDFGDVLIGDTATISYSASWYYSSGESGGSAVALVSTSNIFGFMIANTSNACESGPNIDCTWDLTFTPYFEGPSSFHLKGGLITFTSDAGSGALLGISLFGNGISATPLPAALPLFATGLGAMGLLGWRRKRKAKAAA